MLRDLPTPSLFTIARRETALRVRSSIEPRPLLDGLRIGEWRLPIGGRRNAVRLCRDVPQIDDDGVAILFGPVRVRRPRHGPIPQRTPVSRHTAPQHALHVLIRA